MPWSKMKCVYILVKNGSEFPDNIWHLKSICRLFHDKLNWNLEYYSDFYEKGKV